MTFNDPRDWAPAIIGFVLGICMGDIPLLCLLAAVAAAIIGHQSRWPCAAVVTVLATVAFATLAAGHYVQSAAVIAGALAVAAVHDRAAPLNESGT